MYAFVTSVINFGMYTSELFGSAVTQQIVPVSGQYKNLYQFPILQMACAFVPLTLWGLLPKRKKCSEQGKGE